MPDTKRLGAALKNGRPYKVAAASSGNNTSTKLQRTEGGSRLPSAICKAALMANTSFQQTFGPQEIGSYFFRILAFKLDFCVQGLQGGCIELAEHRR